jgi:ribose-phosphate pyrophosphokinase
MGTELVPTRALTYANSEIYVRFEESVRGADAFVIQSHPRRSTSGSWSS